MSLNDIILNCSICKNSVDVKEDSKNNFYIKCCDKHFKDKNYETLIKKWNKENNFYDYIFGVIFSVDSNNKLKKELDGIVVVDSYVRQQSEDFSLLKDEKLFTIKKDDVLKLCPIVAEISNSIWGLQVRRNAHLPNYKLYRFSFDLELSREEIKNLINYLPDKDLKKYEIGRI